MKLTDLKPGKYIVAVSGGVDSVVLLDLLSNLPGVQLVVTHFNHGMRVDASKDEELVRRLAKKYGLPFEVGYGHLSSKASEEQARDARYSFLEAIRKEYKAKALITAHHQDDLIETAFLNLLRGTGPKGLSAILENPKVCRPLIDMPKKEIIAYAKQHCLQWREDASNADARYLRNHIRQNLIPKLSSSQKRLIISNIQKIAKNNENLSQLTAIISQSIVKDNQVDRQRFINLPMQVQNELIMSWLRQYKVADIDKKTVERLALAIKTGAPGTKYPVRKNLQLELSVKSAQFTNTV